MRVHTLAAGKANSIFADDDTSSNAYIFIWGKYLL